MADDQSLDAIVQNKPDSETRLLAAIAFGEASTANDPEEIAGIAYAVVNRAHAWNSKTVSQILSADPDYTYAANGSNQRFNLLQKASMEEINKDLGMRRALNAAQRALTGQGSDPSGGAFWWDGLDIKTKYKQHPKVKLGFKFGNSTHNIFGIEESTKTVITYWKIRNKKTKQEVNGSERGRFDHVYISTAAHGKTIFWRYNPDYLKATGAKEYR